MKRFILLVVIFYLAIVSIGYASDNTKEFNVRCRITDTIEKAVNGIDGVAGTWVFDNGYQLEVSRADAFCWDEIEPKIIKYLNLEGCCPQPEQKEESPEIGGVIIDNLERSTINKAFYNLIEEARNNTIVSKGYNVFKAADGDMIFVGCDIYEVRDAKLYRDENALLTINPCCKCKDLNGKLIVDTDADSWPRLGSRNR